MPTDVPVLGSLYLQSPSPTQIVNVSRSTCFQLGAFKELLREYRKLDDSIIVRLNRETAMARDQERLSGRARETVQDRACLNLWQELVSNWKRRRQLIDYCVDVVDQSKNENQSAALNEENPRMRRAAEAAAFADQVTRNQVHGELSVDTIVRQRSLQAFRSRCKFFVPPASDSEMWDNANVS